MVWVRDPTEHALESASLSLMNLACKLEEADSSIMRVLGKRFSGVFEPYEAKTRGGHYGAE